MAGDSAATDDSSPIMYASTPKVWRLGDAVIGMAGDWGAIVRAQRIEPQPSIEELTRAWFEALNDFDETDTIVGWSGALYYVNAARECIRNAERIASIGSGSHIAIGALAASQLDAEARVAEAVKIAARYSPNIGGRVVVVHSA